MTYPASAAQVFAHLLRRCISAQANLPIGQVKVRSPDRPEPKFIV
jgi:hypothetical protein